MLKNIVFGVKVATNDDFCQGTVALFRTPENAYCSLWYHRNDLMRDSLRRCGHDYKIG